MRMANQRGFYRRGVFKFFEKSLQSSGGPWDEEGFDFTHSFDLSLMNTD